MTNLPVTVPNGPSGPSSDQITAVIDAMDVSENSRQQYRREIRVFSAWLGNAPLYPNVLLDFKKHLRARTDIGSGTKAKYLNVARAFCRELYRLQILPVDVTANVKGIKVTRQHKRAPITDEEIAKVFEFLNSDAADPRARVIIGLMYFQGLRRVEVARLSVEDYDRQSNTLAVLGKGKDDKQQVDLHPRMVAVLNEYLKSANLKSGPLFPSRENEGKGLTSNMIWRIAFGVHRKLGLETRNLHSYRKAFTTKLIRTGLPLLDVMTFTRHTSVEMLGIYYRKLEREKVLPTFYEAFA